MLCKVTWEDIISKRKVCPRCGSTKFLALPQGLDLCRECADVMKFGAPDLKFLRFYWPSNLPPRDGHNPLPIDEELEGPVLTSPQVLGPTECMICGAVYTPLIYAQGKIVETQHAMTCDQRGLFLTKRENYFPPGHDCLVCTVYAFRPTKYLTRLQLVTADWLVLGPALPLPSEGIWIVDSWSGDLGRVISMRRHLQGSARQSPLIPELDETGLLRFRLDKSLSEQYRKEAQANEDNSLPMLPERSHAPAHRGNGRPDVLEMLINDSYG